MSSDEDAVAVEHELPEDVCEAARRIMAGDILQWNPKAPARTRWFWSRDNDDNSLFCQFQGKHTKVGPDALRSLEDAFANERGLYWHDDHSVINYDRDQRRTEVEVDV